MAGDSFFASGTDGAYARVLNGAHRNPPPRVRPPALVSHVAFWNPVQSTAKLNWEKARQQRKQQADEYIASVWIHLHRAAGEAGSGIAKRRGANSKSSVLRLFANSIDLAADQPVLTPYAKTDSDAVRGVQLVEIRFKWHGADVTIHFEQRREYFTITSVIDLSSCLPSGADALAAAGQENPVGKLARALGELDAKLETNPFGPTSDYQADSEALYKSVWNDFYDHMLLSSQAKQPQLWTLFVDFRGLVLGSPFTGDDSAANWFQQPFWRKSRQDALPSDMPYRRGFDVPVRASSWRIVLDRFWRFLTADINGVHFCEHEFTATGMLHGQVLYVTALGAQPADDLKTPDRTPVFYFVYSNSYSGWQLGRLIERVNFLGTTRIAAMRYYDELRNASYVLQDAAEKIAQAKRGYITKKEASQKSAGSTPEKIGGQWQALLPSLSVDIDNINAMLSGCTKLFNEGIEYRLELAKHYISEFKSGVEALQVTEVEGFQTYDAFVLRRLGPSFGSIETIYTQYQLVTKELASLEDFFSKEQGQLVELQTRNGNKELESLGNIADGALWGALLPYYVGSILLHIFGEEGTPSLPKAIGWLILWNVSVLTGLAVNTYRNLVRLKTKTIPDKDMNKLIRIGLFMVLINVVLIVIYKLHG